MGIIYDNTGTIIPGSSSSNIQYRIKIYTKKSTIFHVQVVQRGSELHRRTIHHLYGPRVVFDVGGKVGDFQFNNVIIQVSTSFAMFALATTLVDFLMLYVLPRREQYYRLKYKEQKVGELSDDEDIEDVESKVEGPAAAQKRSLDPKFPPGMTPPPGMQPGKPGEQQPLLGASK